MPYRQPLLARGPACAMSASRSRWCSRTTPIRPRTPPSTSLRSMLEELPPVMSSRSAARRVRRRALDRADGHRARLRRHRCGVSRPRTRSSRSTLSIGRHTGVPLETRGAIAPLRRRARYAGAVRRRQGAAPQPRRSSPRCSAAAADVGASVRRPCRRRLRRARRALSRGCAGLPRARMRLGRPVKWIEDRHEHLIATNHSRQQRHHIRAAVDADGRILGSTTSSFTTRAPMCAPTARASPTSPPACCPGPIASPPIARSGTSG